MQQHHPPAGTLGPYPSPEWVMRDASGVIAAGGTAQYVSAQPVRGFELHNPHATEDLWVCFNGAPAAPNAVGSIRVQANGGDYWTPDHWPPLLQHVSIYGLTTGHPYTFLFW